MPYSFPDIPLNIFPDIPLNTSVKLRNVRFDNVWKSLQGVVPDATYTPIIANTDTYGSPFNIPYLVTTRPQEVEARKTYGKSRRIEVNLGIPREFQTFYPCPRDKINYGYQLVSGGSTINFGVCRTIDPDFLGCGVAFTADYLYYETQLVDTVYFLQATGVASATGARQVTYSVLAGPIQAAIQPVRQEFDVQLFGTLTDPEHFIIELDNDVTATNSPSVVKEGAVISTTPDTTGTLYQVTQIHDREDLELRTCCECIRKL